MLKKQYIKPTVRVVKLHHQCHILVGSVRGVQDNLGSDQLFGMTAATRTPVDHSATH